MLLVKMPLINLSILRSRVDARPPLPAPFQPRSWRLQSDWRCRPSGQRGGGGGSSGWSQGCWDG